jgi:hypothetical protein
VSMSYEDQQKVEELLKHIFDPQNMFASMPFQARVYNKDFGPYLVFTRNTGTVYTKLTVRYRSPTDRSLLVWCLSYEKLALNNDLRCL